MPRTVEPTTLEHTEAERIQELEQALREKDAALREVQHRAKNSLQLILSLFKLQIGRIRDPEARAAYDQTLQRIEALTMVYRQLHESRAETTVEFGRYLRELVEMTCANLADQVDAIEISLEAEEVPIGLYTTVPVALIVNELLTNSFSHAFPADGWIKIQLLHLADESHARLVISDNGRGLPQGFDDEADACMLLVEALVGQIRGQLAVDHEADSTVVLTFPI